MKSIRNLMPLFVIVVLFVGCSGNTDAPKGAAAMLQLKEKPTPEKFFLKIEPLIANIDDLDVRRFTILTHGQQKVSFHIDTAGVKSESSLLDKDAQPPVHALRP